MLYITSIKDNKVLADRLPDETDIGVIEGYLAGIITDSEPLDFIVISRKTTISNKIIKTLFKNKNL